MDERKRELLEIYKLHATLANHTSQRREGANRLHVALLAGLLILVGILAEPGGSRDEGSAFWFAILLGLLLSVSWYFITRSCRQLNSGKFEALIELEKELAYPFFTREWALLEQGKDYRKYWKLTVVETFLPAVFFLMFLGAAMAALSGS